MNRARIVAAVHGYARARARADFTLADPDVSADEFGRRTAAVRRSAERMDELIVSALPEAVGARDAYTLVAEFTSQVETYITNRRSGHGPGVAADAIAAIDALLAIRAAAE